MKNLTLAVLIASSNLAFSENVIHEDYNPKPMIEGNHRVDELIEWSKNNPGQMAPLTEQEKNEFFTKKGVPLPGTGAKVVDSKSIKMSSSQSISVAKFNSDQKTKGYSEQENKNAKFLLAMPETAEKEYNLRKSVAFDPRDTHLYEVKNNLAISYSYKGVPAELATKVIGYAPESTFVNNSWTGAVEFFIPSFGGVCAYREVNIGITKSSAYIPKEIATFLVNKKVTTVNVVGNNESGFIYEVEWWDKSFKRTLECANKELSRETRISTINLAKRIDSAQG